MDNWGKGHILSSIVPFRWDAHCYLPSGHSGHYQILYDVLYIFDKAIVQLCKLEKLRAIHIILTYRSTNCMSNRKDESKLHFISL